MRTLTKRLHGLEKKSGGARDLFDVAVLSNPLPEAATTNWSRAMLDAVGWNGERVGLWVVDGEPKALLAITPCDERLAGEEEQAWLRAGRTYPHYVILAAGDQYATYRLESERDWKAMEEIDE